MNNSKFTIEENKKSIINITSTELISNKNLEFPEEISKMLDGVSELLITSTCDEDWDEAWDHLGDEIFGYCITQRNCPHGFRERCTDEEIIEYIQELNSNSEPYLLMLRNAERLLRMNKIAGSFPANLCIALLIENREDLNKIIFLKNLNNTKILYIKTFAFLNYKSDLSDFILYNPAMESINPVSNESS